MVAGAGFEPTAFGLWARRATKLLHPAINKWRRKRDSNPCADFSTSRFSRPVPSTRLGYFSNKWCLRPDLNRHGVWSPQDFKSCASTNFATQAHFIYIHHFRWLLHYITLFCIWQLFFIKKVKKWLKNAIIISFLKIVI